MTTTERTEELRDRENRELCMTDDTAERVRIMAHYDRLRLIYAPIPRFLQTRTLANARLPWAGVLIGDNFAALARGRVSQRGRAGVDGESFYCAAVDASLEAELLADD